MDNYSNGTRVRINARRGFREPYADLWQYDNLTGAIISSSAVTRYQIRSWEGDWHTPSEVVQAYKIHLDVGIEADNVIEESLEAWKATAAHANPSGYEEAGARETHCAHGKFQVVERSYS